MSSDSFKSVLYKICLAIIYMYKPDLALNNLQLLICHKTQQNQNTITEKNIHTFGSILIDSLHENVS